MKPLNEHEIETILTKFRGLSAPEHEILRAKNVVLATVRKSDPARLPTLERSRRNAIIIRKFNFNYMILAIVLALLLGGGGTVAAAQNDLPGDALYGVKIASERVAEKLARSDEAKVRLEAKLAARRTHELAALNVNAQAAAKAETPAPDASTFADRMANAADRLTAHIDRMENRVDMLKDKDTEGTLKAATMLEAKVDMWEDVLAAVQSSATQAELRAKLQAAREKAQELRAATNTAQNEAVSRPPENGLESAATGRVGAADNKLTALTRRRAAIEEKVNASGDAQLKARFAQIDAHYQTAVRLVAEAKAALTAHNWQTAWDKANAAFKEMVQFNGGIWVEHADAGVNAEGRVEAQSQFGATVRNLTPEQRAQLQSEMEERVEERAETLKERVDHLLNPTASTNASTP